MFRFTLPSGERPLYTTTILCYIFQLTLPLGERLLGSCKSSPFSSILIHAPAWERRFLQADFAVLPYFNPRSRLGSDDQLIINSQADNPARHCCTCDECRWWLSPLPNSLYHCSINILTHFPKNVFSHTFLTCFFLKFSQKREPFKCTKEKDLYQPFPQKERHPVEAECLKYTYT